MTEIRVDVFKCFSPNASIEMKKKLGRKIQKEENEGRGNQKNKKKRLIEENRSWEKNLLVREKNI